MANYVCNRCGAVFNEYEADTINELHTEVHPHYTEHFLACPKCGASDYETAARCARCGRPMLYGDLHGGYYCDECIWEIAGVYQFKEYIRENLDDFAEWLHEKRQKNNADSQP